MSTVHPLVTSGGFDKRSAPSDSSSSSAPPPTLPPASAAPAPREDKSPFDARKKWIHVSRRASLAARIIAALKPAESRYFSYGRIVGGILSEGCLFWPFQDVRCAIVDFATKSCAAPSFIELVNYRQTFTLASLHFLEDILENFVTERDILDPRLPDFRYKLKLETLFTLFSWSVFHAHQRILIGEPFAQPFGILNGLISRFLSIAPFLGGFDSRFGNIVQFFWLGVMFKPLNVVSFFCARKQCHDIAAVKRIYSHSGIRGFYTGALSDLKICVAMLTAHALSDLDVPAKFLGGVLVAAAGAWKCSTGILQELGCLATTAVGTTLLKLAVHRIFGEPPVRADRKHVEETKIFIEGKARANRLLSELSRRASEIPFRPTVDLRLNLFTTTNRPALHGSEQGRVRLRSSAADEFSVTLPDDVSEVDRVAALYDDAPEEPIDSSTPSSSSDSHTDDGDDRAPVPSNHSCALCAPKDTRVEDYYPAFLYMSGFVQEYLFANGRYDLITDERGAPVLQHGKPQYRHAVENRPGRFMYIAFIHYDDESPEWALVEHDRTTILAYCEDNCQDPCECKNFWHVCTFGEFEKDPTVKASREPTLFLQRIAVIKSLNKMLQEGECDASDIEKTVKPAEYFNLLVRRDQLAKSSLQALLGAQASELIAQDFRIRFKDEHGLDYGGVKREWFGLLSHELMRTEGLELQLWDRKVRTDGSLFVNLNDNTLLPVGTAPLEFYVAIGRALAMALLHKAFFPLPLNFVVFKYILEKPITAADVQHLDPDFFRHRLWTLAQPGGAKKIADMLGEPLTFVSAASGGSMGGVPLIENGEKISVTEDNKMWYVRYVTIEYLCGDIDKQLQALVSGFWDLCPRKALRHMKQATDLQALIQGPKEPLDVDRLEEEAQLSPENKKHKIQFDWFFAMLREFKPEEQVRMLQFATGSSRIPLEGLKPAFTLVINSTDQKQLPISHTCSNMISMPAYSSYEVMVAKCKIAFDFHSGFGFE